MPKKTSRFRRGSNVVTATVSLDHAGAIAGAHTRTMSASHGGTLPFLSSLAERPTGLPRLLHGLGHRHPFRLAQRGGQIAWEVGYSALLDRVRPIASEILECREGAAGWHNPGVALYAHWSPTGRISPMVVRQAATWRACGLDVVFVTSAPAQPGDLDAVAPECSLIIRRRNIGYDFASWRDALQLLTSRGRQPSEVLLANDSVLGPFKPLPPLVSMMRAGGEGWFGMTESLAGGVHLQSYAVLARGAAALEQLRFHLAAIPLGRSKWRVVQAGEIALTRRMRAAGLRCGALFGYAALCELARPADMQALGARFTAPGAMATYPLNPTHHLWRLLLEVAGFPFIKAELVRHNPGRLPGVQQWGALVSAEDRALTEEHLRLMALPAGADANPGSALG